MLPGFIRKNFQSLLRENTSMQKLTQSQNQSDTIRNGVIDLCEKSNNQQNKHTEISGFGNHQDDR